MTEIISLLQNQNGDENNDKSMSTPKGPSPAEAFAAFKTGLEWFERQAVGCPAELLLL